MVIFLGLGLFSISGLPLRSAGDPLLCWCQPIRVCRDSPYRFLIGCWFHKDGLWCFHILIFIKPRFFTIGLSGLCKVGRGIGWLEMTPDCRRVSLYCFFGLDYSDAGQSSVAKLSDIGLGMEGIGLGLGAGWQGRLSDMTFSYFYLRYILTLLSL